MPKNCIRCNVELPVGQKQTYLLAPSYEGKVLCRACARYSSLPCVSCGVRLYTGVQNSRDHFIQTPGGAIYCIQCSKDLKFCNSCNRVLSKTEKTFSIKTRKNGSRKGICSYCASMNSGANWDYNPRQLNYHSLAPRFTKKEGAFYGIELETDGYSDRSTTLRELHVHHQQLKSPAFWLKSDGSLRNGIEICFHPRTIPSWVEFLTSPFYTEMKTIMEKYGGASYDTNTSGLHIHREHIGITPELKNKLVFFISHHRDQIQVVAQRRGNAYCSYNRFSPDSFKKLQDVARAIKAGMFSGRMALTLNSHHKTIEFRLFKGTLAPKTLIAQLGFTDALLGWLDRHTDEILEDLAEQKAMWDKFMVDLSLLENPTIPFIHEFLTRKGFYTIAVR